MQEQKLFNLNALIRNRQNSFFLIILSILTLHSFLSSAQFSVHGVPFITNYTKKELGFNSENHAIIQDSRGIIYTANNYGILEFDGQNWTIIQNATNGSNIKSIAIDENDRIYAGAQGDLGYLDYHEKYDLIFRSLTYKIPKEHRNFGDVWQTHVISNGVVFHSWDATFIYTNDTIKVIKFENLSNESFKIKDTVYIQSKNGIYYLNNKFEPIKTTFSPFFSNKEITFMVPFGDNGKLINTKKHGLYTIIGQQIIPFTISSNINFEIRQAVLLKNGYYLLSTLNNGFIVINNKGTILQHLTKNDGLSSNRINGMFIDNADNLWLCSKGIDYLETSSPFSTIHIDKNDPLAVYSTIIYNNLLYIATHQGVYVTKWNMHEANQVAKSFNKVNNLPSIIWNLQNINNQLIASTENGFYEINKYEAKIIAKTEGAWLLKKANHLPNTYLGGTYKGLVSLTFNNNKLQLLKTISGFNLSSRILEFDKDGNIWTSHGYNGTYKLKLNQNFDSIINISIYNKQKGFPSNLYTGVYKVGNELVFSSQYGFYSYDHKSDSMVINQFFGNKVGTSKHVRYIHQNKNKIWFIYGNESGYIEKYANGTSSVNIGVFNKLEEHYIPGFENFYFLENGNAIIGTKEDLVYYNSNTSVNTKKSFNTLLRSVECPLKNEIIYLDHYEFLCDTSINENPEIRYEHNNLIFRFAASFYENIDNLKFSYYLEGFDKAWSVWGSDNYKEYTNIPEGEYIFRIKALNTYGTVSSETSYTFTILPPWYRTTWAYMLYTTLILLFIAVLFKARDKQLTKEKKKFIEEQNKHQALKEAQYNEEKLKNELENKNTELASLASNVIYKNERISEIKAQLSELTPIAADKVKKKLNKVLVDIENELEDDNWENFEYRFNQAHKNFLKRFKETYPELTPKDLKFCAYLRMNLSTKEIAQLLNMTIRGVENARYRIRKRVNLDSKDSLTNFIITF